MLNKNEIEILQNQPYEERKKYANKVSEVINNFLEVKYKGIHGLSIAYETLYYLLDGDFDFQSEIFTVKHTCKELLKVLSHPATKEIKDFDTAEAAKVLIRMMDFCEAIDEESSQAQLALAWIEENGGGDIHYLANLEKEYSGKTKISEYKRLHHLDPDTRNEMGLEDS